MRAARFLTVGVLAIPLNTGILWALTDWAHIYYLLSSVVAVEISIIARFFANHVWTFRATHERQSLVGRLLKFNLASVGGLLLNVAGLFFFSHIVGLHYLLANICGIGLGTTWNYSISRAWIWRSHPVGSTGSAIGAAQVTWDREAASR